jgi:carbon-monoxide dehydrogenase small subunit
MEKRTIVLEVNGERREVALHPNVTLLEGLRELGCFEVKRGCEKGDCGACAVLVEGEAVDSCLMLAWAAEGTRITTVVGLGDADAPHPLQAAFIAGGAVQCGYCIPGMIIAAKALIDEHPEPSDEQIRAGLGGNLCRCTGFTRIFAAVREAAAELRAEGERP